MPTAVEQGRLAGAAAGDRRRKVVIRISIGIGIGAWLDMDSELVAVAGAVDHEDVAIGDQELCQWLQVC